MGGSPSVSISRTKAKTSVPDRGTPSPTGLADLSFAGTGRSGFDLMLYYQVKLGVPDHKA